MGAGHSEASCIRSYYTDKSTWQQGDDPDFSTCANSQAHQWSNSGLFLRACRSGHLDKMQQLPKIQDIFYCYQMSSGEFLTH